VPGMRPTMRLGGAPGRGKPAGRNYRVLAVAAAIVLAAGIVGAIKAAGAPPGIMTASSFTCADQGAQATTRVTVASANRQGTGDDFAAIQDAIDAAARRGGGVVALPAGTFLVSGHLVLRSNVTLTGVGPATVIKAGPGFMSAQGPAGGYPIITTAGASNVTIADLTADQNGGTLGGNVPARLTGYAVEGRDSRNVVINGVHVRNPFTYSIAMVGSEGFCIENSTVRAGAPGRYNQLDGIHILDSSSGQVINNVVQSGDDGLVAHTIGAPVHDILYANNTVYGGSTDDGLKLAVGGFAVYNIRIEHNDFYGSATGVGTAYYDGGAGVLRNISVSGNYIHDLTLGGTFPAVEIGGAGRRGIVEDVTVTDNRICAAGVVAVQPGPGNSISGATGC
jgi:polygalacturonase